MPSGTTSNPSLDSEMEEKLWINVSYVVQQLTIDSYLITHHNYWSVIEKLKTHGFLHSPFPDSDIDPRKLDLQYRDSGKIRTQISNTC